MCDSAVCREASRARLEAAVYSIAYPELSTRAQSAISTAVDLLALPDYFNSPADPWQRLARAFALQTERLAKELADGRITPQRWRADMDTLILLRHIEAHEIGQAAAGIKPIPSRAATAGKVIRDFESFYLQGFFEDIVQGRMNDSAGALSLPRVQARARMYVLKTRSTQAQGFVDGSPQEASFDWKLGAVEDHCEECPYIASQGPYYQQTLYTHPGEGDTPCLVNCVVDGDALVATRRGMVKIRDITDLDEVLTHTGRFRSVTMAWSRITDNDTQTYVVKNGDRVTEFTGSHKIATEDGWNDAESVYNRQLMVYTIDDAKVLREMLGANAVRPQERLMQGLRFELPLWEQEGPSGERVYVMREEKGRIISVGEPSAAVNDYVRDIVRSREAANYVFGFGLRELQHEEARRSALRSLLDNRREEGLRVPLSLGVGVRQWPNPGWHGDTPYQSESVGRQTRESQTGYTGGTSRDSQCGWLGECGNNGEAWVRDWEARVDMRELRGCVQEVSKDARLSAEVLRGRVLPRGSKVWDIQVEGDESFVVNGVVAHNCKCFLVRDDGAVSALPFGVNT